MRRPARSFFSSLHRPVRVRAGTRRSSPRGGRWTWALLALFAASLGGAGCDAADGRPTAQLPAFPEALGEELAQLVAAELPRVGAPGVAVGVVLPSGARWRGAAGYASLAPSRLVEPGDRFRIGSVTKVFVAALVLELAQDGLVSLGDPLDDHVPGFDLGPEVTLRRLLDHTAGIFNYTDDLDFLVLGAEPAEPDEVIAFALDHGRLFPPGEGWAYSNTGYFLLGLAIEAARDAPLATVLRERISHPLGLLDTFLDGAEQVVGGMVEGHVLGTELTDAVHMSWSWAAGGMVSTVDDLCTWARALRDGWILAPDLREVLTDWIPTPDEEADSYGAGLQQMARAGRTVVGHTGSTIGFNGELFVDPADGTCVALLTNDFMARRQPLADALWGSLTGHGGRARPSAP